MLHDRAFEELGVVVERIALNPADLDFRPSSAHHLRVVLIHRLTQGLLIILDFDHGGNEFIAVADGVICALATI